MARLFVGSLSWDTNEADLAEFFHTQGYLVKNVKIMIDRDTTKSRGFGFADIDDEAMQKAIEDCHGQTLDGRTITVKEAEERQPRGGGQNRSRR